MPSVVGAGLSLERQRLPPPQAAAAESCIALQYLVPLGCWWGGGVAQGSPHLESPGTAFIPNLPAPHPTAPQDPVPSATPTLGGPQEVASQSSQELGSPGCVSWGRPARQDPFAWMQLEETSRKPEAAAAQHRSQPHTHQGDNSVISRPAVPRQHVQTRNQPAPGSPRGCLFNPFFKVTLNAVGWCACACMPKLPTLMSVPPLRGSSGLRGASDACLLAPKGLLGGGLAWEGRKKLGPGGCRTHR